MTSKDNRELIDLLQEAKTLAKRYYALTGRPLGVTGEVAEFEAVRLLKLTTAPVRQAGYDATGRINGRNERIQIKSRCFPDGIKPSAKIGKIDVDKPCDSVLLVLLDADFNATTIYWADWESVRAALIKPGSKARNSRGQLSVSKFKSLGSQIWPRAR
jgi:Family of unknown function (DUF6998)